MGLGPTLVGGVIGAAVGMLLHLIVETVTGFEAPWFAIIIGLLTGLGVHQANKSLAGRVSYVRGALAAAIALAAIVGSTPLISLVASKKDAAAAAPKGVAVAQTAEDDDKGGGGTGEAAPIEQPVLDESRLGGPAGAGGMHAQPGFEVWQFVFMAVGTFIAYEFGRGSNPHAPKAPESAEPSEPVMTDPSN